MQRGFTCKTVDKNRSDQEGNFRALTCIARPSEAKNKVSASPNPAPLRKKIPPNFSFAALGDTNYTVEQDVDYLELMKNVINEEKPVFLVHVGDINADPAAFEIPSAPGQTWLSIDTRDYQMIDTRNYWWTNLDVPFIIVPGDNDWSDQIKIPLGPLPPGQGASDLPNLQPVQTLDEFRQVWYGDGMNVEPSFEIVRQSNEYPQQYSDFVENARWVYRDIVFVILHTISGNNGLSPSASPSPTARQAVLNETANVIFSGSIADTILTVTSFTPTLDGSLPGTLSVGQNLTSHYTNGTGVAIGTTITQVIVPGSQYRVNIAQNVAARTIYAGGRINANLIWLRDAFNLTEAIGARGIVIFTQGLNDISREAASTTSTGFHTPSPGYSAMMYVIRQRTLENLERDVQTLFIYGDSHFLHISKPLPISGTYPSLSTNRPDPAGLPNFTAIQVPGQSIRNTVGSQRVGMNGRVKISVDLNSPSLFSVCMSMTTL